MEYTVCGKNTVFDNQLVSLIIPSDSHLNSITHLHDYVYYMHYCCLPILNSLLAIRISALGMMGGGRQNCSLYALRKETNEVNQVVSIATVCSRKHKQEQDHLHTLIANTE